MSQSRLENIFQKAFCTTDVPDGAPMVCCCGLEYRGPGKQGQVADQILVLGCQCPLASSFGGLFWRHRHEVANFLRGMAEELDRENVRLRGELPPTIGTSAVALDGNDARTATEVCRDHWKTSYEHERVNVIRLRKFQADAHARGFGLPPPGQIPCRCNDCVLVRKHAGQALDTDPA